MNDKLVVKKGIFIGICAFIGDEMGIIVSELSMFIFLMVLDYISGMLAAKKEAIEHPYNKKYGWSSKKGVVGIYKKIGYMMTVLAAICIDYIIFKFVEEIGIPYENNTLFGVLVLIWFIINELLSILENVKRIGVKLPEVLERALMELKRKIDKK